jgi:hypothetical protein
VPAVVRRLEEHRLPELVVAAVAGDPDVSHAAAAPGGFPGRFADARRPAHLRLSWITPGDDYVHDGCEGQPVGLPVGHTDEGPVAGPGDAVREDPGDGFTVT